MKHFKKSFPEFKGWILLSELKLYYKYAKEKGLKGTFNKYLKRHKNIFPNIQIVYINNEK